VHLRYTQIVCVGIELDSRQRAEVVVEEDLSEAAVDVAPACRDSRILFRDKHFLLESGVVAIARYAQCTGGEAVQSAAKVSGVRVEPVGID